MGLLTDTYSDILKKLQGVNLRDENDFSSMDSDFNDGSGFKVSLRDRETPKGAFDSAPFFIKGPVNYFVPPGTEKTGQVKIPFTDKSIRVIPESAMSNARTVEQKNKSANLAMGQISKIPKQDAKSIVPAVKVDNNQVTSQLANDDNFLNKLANLAGTDLDKATATWKEKGGFEGLMSNPAFTIGLAFLQAGAEGKSLGAGALDNVIKAGAVSQQYKKIIESRKQAPIQATAADISEVKNLLGKVGISEGNWFENFGAKVQNFFNKNKGSRNPGLDYDRAVEEIAVQYQAKVVAKQKELAAANKPTILRVDDKLKIMEELIESGVIQKRSAWFKGLFTDDTLQKVDKGLAHGGTAHQGKSYLVGEKGPEVFIPKETG